MEWDIQGDALSADDRHKIAKFVETKSRLTQGDTVQEFESKFAEWQGSLYAVFMGSGSLANLLLISALKELHGWADGAGVIVPAVTWPTTVTPIMQLGLEPVFVDVNLDDLGLNYLGVSDQIPDTKGIEGVFVVHLLGLPQDMEHHTHFLDIFGPDITLIEDCCEALGAKSDGKRVGNFGAAGTFSFYWAHHLTTLEGGMVCTDDYDLYRLLLLKRSHGMARELPKKEHESIKLLHLDTDFQFLFLTDGFNARGNNLTAYMGLLQLEQLDGFLEQRTKNYERFIQICKQFDDYLIVPKVESTPSFALPFIFKKRKFKERFYDLLVKEGVEVRPMVSGNLLRHPFLDHLNIDPASYPNADLLHFNAFYIGNHQGIGDLHLVWLVGKMEEFFNAC